MPKTKSIMQKIGDKFTNGKDIYICDYDYKRKRRGRPPYQIFIKQENKEVLADERLQIL